ncbi:Endospore coat-associated protein YheD [Oceanobacillus oncorhynchi]|uniref:Endospore coat-associated protein YheD n=1 Tax=Oceanobacillus oncorhynchi TaxID=545501 RepID=A0A0A1MMF3_9BACI|nr:YheC/YheD family protein [Oceanobacillus oncorhynchi]CEI80832.1 Endospore coat-associated protein YheD [Oceanobacillus oncorhynchi]
MEVGLLRPFIQPTFMSKFTSLVAKAKGIDIIYFRIRDIDQENHKINGKILIDDEWVNIVTNIPKVIDVSAFTLKHKEEIEYLNKRSILTENGKKRMTKATLQTRLYEDEHFKKYIIPSEDCSSFSVVEEFLNLYHTVIIKPVSGQKGQGIYKVSKQNENQYELSYQQSKRMVSHQELNEFFTQDILSTERKHIVQKYITSTTPDGSPFDCRVHLEKNRKGEWTIPKIFVRIGLGQKVTSNISQGGGSSDADVFFKTYYKEKADDILVQLEQLGYDIAAKIEKLRSTELMTMGLDVGVDADGELYIFEVNSAPGTTRLRSDVVLLRTDYYKYLYSKKRPNKQ